MDKYQKLGVPCFEAVELVMLDSRYKNNSKSSWINNVCHWLIMLSNKSTRSFCGISTQYEPCS